MICPRCMYEQPYAEECINCGVVVEKYVTSNGGDYSPPDESFEIKQALMRARSFESKSKAAKASETHKLLFFILVISIIGFFSIVFINDYLTKDKIRTKIKEAIETRLRYDFHEDVIAKHASFICKSDRLMVEPEDIRVEFLPDKFPLREESVHYSVNVSIPYDVNLFFIQVPSEIKIVVMDSIRDDGGLKTLKFKEKLDVY